MRPLCFSRTLALLLAGCGMIAGATRTFAQPLVRLLNTTLTTPQSPPIPFKPGETRRYYRLELP